MTTFRGVPPYLRSNIDEWALQGTKTINGVLQGKTNNTGTFTLTASTVSSSFTVAEGIIGQNSEIFFTPHTPNAATEFGAGSIYITKDVANTKFIVTHASTADADKIFGYIVVGG